MGVGAGGSMSKEFIPLEGSMEEQTNSKSRLVDGPCLRFHKAYLSRYPSPSFQNLNPKPQVDPKS